MCLSTKIKLSLDCWPLSPVLKLGKFFLPLGVEGAVDVSLGRKSWIPCPFRDRSCQRKPMRWSKSWFSGQFDLPFSTGFQELPVVALTDNTMAVAPEVRLLSKKSLWAQLQSRKPSSHNVCHTNANVKHTLLGAKRGSFIPSNTLWDGFYAFLSQRVEVLVPENW